MEESETIASKSSSSESTSLPGSTGRGAKGQQSSSERRTSKSRGKEKAGEKNSSTSGGIRASKQDKTAPRSISRPQYVKDSSVEAGKDSVRPGNSEATSEATAHPKQHDSTNRGKNRKQRPTKTVQRGNVTEDPSSRNNKDISVAPLKSNQRGNRRTENMPRTLEDHGTTNLPVTSDHDAFDMASVTSKETDVARRARGNYNQDETRTRTKHFEKSNYRRREKMERNWRDQDDKEVKHASDNERINFKAGKTSGIEIGTSVEMESTRKNIRTRQNKSKSYAAGRHVIARHEQTDGESPYLNDKAKKKDITSTEKETAAHAKLPSKKQINGNTKFNANAREFYPKNYGKKQSSSESDIHGKNFKSHGTTYFTDSMQEDRREKPEHEIMNSEEITSKSRHHPQSRNYKPSNRPNEPQNRRRDNMARRPNAIQVKPPPKFIINSEQAMTLMEQLNTGDYECMVCCDKVHRAHSTWSCSTCYHLFHLRCVKKWSKSDAAGVRGHPGWRCPACQSVSIEWPEVYVCFCGKVENPQLNPGSLITPHSCGEVCGRPHSSVNCEHPCTELCHPGACPSCPVMVKKSCCCGNKTFSVRCGNTAARLCGNICNRMLNCRVHLCERKCHDGSCEDCNLVIAQSCHCGKHQRDILCEAGLGSGDGRNFYSCSEKCNRTLPCNNHKCEDVCHAGSCQMCSLSPGVVRTCHCGKTLIENITEPGEMRTSCLDPLPCCSLTCDKALICGPSDNRHHCKMRCHEGECGTCDQFTVVSCRCGSSSKEVACSSLTSGYSFECERRCNRKKQCGRHRCNVKCCTDSNHMCTLVCGKKLQCGHHKCEEFCHRGYCQQCWQVGFEEVSCYCGATVALPPIQCGAPPPECPYPCTRSHSCGHSPQHNCHMEESCPPCAILVDKLCMGEHEIRHSIPCHVENVSCGQLCGKELSCGLHNCQQTCHKGACLDDGETCPQPCQVPRSACEHPCSSKCHVGSDCPTNRPCKALITITCDCGRKTEQVACLAGQSGSGYQKIMSATIGNKLRDLQAGQSVDISTLFTTDKQLKSLPCDEECLTQERNRRLAIAFKINLDSKMSTAPAYSQFLKDQARDNLPFIKSIESAIEDIVSSAKRTSVAQRTHSFNPMGTVQRRVIHELAKFYDCTTYSLDKEPMRSTVVTATKASTLPSMRLSTVAENEVLPPLPPRPVLLLDSSAITFKQSSDESRSKSGHVPNYFDDDSF